MRRIVEPGLVIAAMIRMAVCVFVPMFRIVIVRMTVIRRVAVRVIFVFVIMSMRVVVTVVVPTLGFLSVFVFVRHLRVPFEFVLELSELCVSVVHHWIFHRGGTEDAERESFVPSYYCLSPSHF
jgi:hypothetical protein